MWKNRDTWRNSVPNIRRGALQKIAYGLRNAGVKTANETLGEITTDLGRDTL